MSLCVSGGRARAAGRFRGGRGGTARVRVAEQLDEVFAAVEEVTVWLLAALPDAAPASDAIASQGYEWSAERPES